MKITPVAPENLADCQAIYGHHILHGTGMFAEMPPSLEELAARCDAIRRAGWAWLVATGPQGVLGFGYYAQFRPLAGYRFTAEDSVYVRDSAQRQGVGKALVAALLHHAAAQGFKQMLALIGDSANAGSIGVHTSLGFTHAGIMRDVGYKFGRWLDVVTMQKSLSTT